MYQDHCWVSILNSCSKILYRKCGLSTNLEVGGLTPSVYLLNHSCPKHWIPVLDNIVLSKRSDGNLVDFQPEHHSMPLCPIVSFGFFHFLCLHSLFSYVVNYCLGFTSWLLMLALGRMGIDKNLGIRIHLSALER